MNNEANEINKEDLEAASDAFDRLAKGTFYKDETNARRFLGELSNAEGYADTINAMLNKITPNSEDISDRSDQ